MLFCLFVLAVKQLAVVEKAVRWFLVCFSDSQMKIFTENIYFPFDGDTNSILRIVAF